MALTPKQESFCLAYMETGNASEAYRRCYNASRSTAKTITETACKLLAQPNISARIAELKAAVVERFLWEREDSLRVLSGIANKDNEAATARIAAVKELNAMHGYNVRR